MGNATTHDQRDAAGAPGAAPARSPVAESPVAESPVAESPVPDLPVPGRPVPDLDVPAGQDMWVFGYGSLMWNPGFPFAESSPAVLRGYHRRFCIYSHRYRGTERAPGLVLGLDRGGSCRGIAFRVEARQVRATLAYLWDREMIAGVYRPKLKPVRLTCGRAVEACCFLVNRANPQYCGDLDPGRAAALICSASGQSGSNWDYLVNTVRHLERIGIRDRPLEALAARVGNLRAAAARSGPAGGP